MTRRPWDLAIAFNWPNPALAMKLGGRLYRGEARARKAPEARAKEDESQPHQATSRGLARPQYRLRVGEFRVFYDVADMTVEILAILSKSEAESWLAQFGSPE